MQTAFSCTKRRPALLRRDKCTSKLGYPCPSVRGAKIAHEWSTSASAECKHPTAPLHPLFLASQPPWGTARTGVLRGEQAAGTGVRRGQASVCAAGEPRNGVSDLEYAPALGKKTRSYVQIYQEGPEIAVAALGGEIRNQGNEEDFFHCILLCVIYILPHFLLFFICYFFPLNQKR